MRFGRCPGYDEVPVCKATGESPEARAWCPHWLWVQQGTDQRSLDFSPEGIKSTEFSSERIRQAGKGASCLAWVDITPGRLLRRLCIRNRVRRVSPCLRLWCPRHLLPPPASRVLTCRSSLF